MRLTLSAIKADVGSIGGHTRPSDDMLETVRGAGPGVAELGFADPMYCAGLMLPCSELEYGGFRDTVEGLLARFETRR